MSDAWDSLRRQSTAEEIRIIDFYKDLVEHHASDGTLQRRVLPLVNRVVHEGASCYEYRQNAPFYLKVFTIVQSHCADSNQTLGTMVKKLASLTED